MFYDRLKEICKTKNIKITVLLNDLKMSSGNVSSWKKGNVPKAATIEKIADYLGIKTDYLLGRTDDSTPPPRPDILHRRSDGSQIILETKGINKPLTPEQEDKVYKLLEVAMPELVSDTND